jgi:hypothetical protein
MVPTPRQDHFCLLVFHFLKCILVVQGGFALVSHTCIYCTSTKLTPSITLSLSLCYLTFKTIKCFHYTSVIHRCTYFKIIHSLSFTFLLPLLSDSLSQSNFSIYLSIYLIYHLYHCVYIGLPMYLCIHLSFRSSFHIVLFIYSYVHTLFVCLYVCMYCFMASTYERKYLGFVF